MVSVVTSALETPRSRRLARSIASSAPTVARASSRGFVAARASVRARVVVALCGVERDVERKAHFPALQNAATRRAARRARPRRARGARAS